MCILDSLHYQSDIAKEYSFMKEIKSPFWDKLTSTSLDEEELERLRFVMEFMKDDF